MVAVTHADRALASLAASLGLFGAAALIGFPSTLAAALAQLGFIFAITAVLLGAAWAYLRLFVGPRVLLRNESTGDRVQD